MRFRRNDIFSGLDPVDSITDKFCDQTKVVFDDINDHAEHGGLKAMGESMERGHVLVMSMWDDHDANMLWLDSNYPLDKVVSYSKFIQYHHIKH